MRKLKDIHCHMMEPCCLVPEGDFLMPDLSNAENILKIAEECGYDAINIPAITLHGEKDLVCNPLSLLAKCLGEKRGKKVYALAGVPKKVVREENQNMRRDAEELMACGFDGFKMICKPNVRAELRFPINDPIFDGFYQAAEENGWPILFHVGDPATFWNKEEIPDWAVQCGWYYGEDEWIPSYEELYRETEDVLRRFPNLKMTFAHFFFLSWDLKQAAHFMDTYPNVRFDVTPGCEMYPDFSANPEGARGFFVKYQGRILFGTDMVSAPDGPIEAAIEGNQKKVGEMLRFFETEDEFIFDDLPVKGIGLPEDACEALFHGAFDAFLGNGGPAAVNREKTVELIEKYISRSREMTGDAETIGLLDQIREKMQEM